MYNSWYEYTFIVKIKKTYFPNATNGNIDV